MHADDRPFLITDCVPNRTRFNVPYLTRFISGRKNEEVEFYPSKWRKEMAKTTEDMFDLISKSVINRYLAPEFGVPDEICVRPPLLVFRNDGLKTTNKLSFSITNRSKHSLDLSCDISRSEVFQVQIDQITLRRLSPRQSVIVSVRYTPNSEEDDFYVIKFNSKRGSFNIPMLSIGPRYLVSCNDSVIIDEAYINMQFSALLALSNFGPRQLDLIMFTCPPFTVEPSRMILEPYSCGKVEVSMKADCVGKHMGKLRINHGMGDDVFVDLIGVVVLGDVTLDKNVVKFPGVYMNTKERETVTLQSNVQHPVSYCWRRYKTEAEDKAQIDRLHEMLGSVYSINNRQNLDATPNIISQNVINKDVELTKPYDCFLFDNPFFKIEPLTVLNKFGFVSVHNSTDDSLMSSNFDDIFKVFQIGLKCPQYGTIPPMSTLECFVFFHPEQLVPHNVKAYLHIECRAERAELELEGLVLGPSIDISVTMVDLSHCQYLTHRGLDIIFTNNGPIEGTVRYLGKNSSIVCEPTSLDLKALKSACMILLINFIQKGPFLTELKFMVVESGKILTICLKGTVVGLPISIDCDELNFGVVALGFSNSLTFNFHNGGDNHFEYHFVIANDGTQPPLKISEFAQNIRSKFPASPKEFYITPHRGVIKPKSRISVEVVFIPNKYYERPTELSVLVNGVVIEDLNLRISYYCHHPMITCNPFEFDLRYLIYNESVDIEFIITNEGSAPAAFVLSIIGKALQATFSRTTGILESGHSIPITATLTPVKLGSGTVTVGVDLFGRSVIEEVVWLNYICSAPSLTINPHKLEWHITELTSKDDQTKQMTISNPFQTPIFCRIKLDKSQARMWRVRPRKAIVEFEQVVTLKPVIIDFGKSVFTLSVVYHCHRDEIKLIVDSNISTAIRSVPTIFKGFDFGNVLKNTHYSNSVKFINVGMKSYSVMSKPREKDIYTNPFTIKPRSFSIKGKEKIDVCMEFQNDKFGSQQSTFDIIILDKRPKKCQIGTCTLKANVVPRSSAVSWEPNVLELSISSKEILSVEGSIKVFTTVSCLDEIECAIHHPFFSIINEDNGITDSTKFTISPSASKTVTVLFNPSFCPERFARFQTKMSLNSAGIKNAVNINGEINYPHFTWSTQIVDFGCLYPFQGGHEEVRIMNNTSETLSFDCRYISIFETRPVHIPPNEKEKEDDEEEETEEETEEDKEAESEVRPPTASAMVNSRPLSSSPDNTKPTTREVTKLGSRKSMKMRKGKSKSIRKKSKKSKEAERNTEERMMKLISQPNEELIAIAQKEITNTLIPVLSGAEEIKPFEGIQGLRRYLKTPIPLDRFNEFFLISPMSGQVRPGESLKFSIAYLPREPSETVEAEVSVYRDEDYEETLKLKGSCRQSFQYEITPLNVNLGIIPFCEITTFDVYITNLTECSMEVEVLNIMEEDAKDTRFQRLGTICVKPKNVIVNAYSTEVLTVIVHPVVLSWFTKKYQIKIHGIQDEIFTIQGESSLHYLNLEHPFPFDDIPIVEQYKGLKIMFNRHQKPGDKLAKPSSDVCLLSPGDEFDWEMVYVKGIPETAELNNGTLMGIAERTSEIYCEEYYQHAKSHTRTDPLPHLVLPKQVIDLGGTIIEERNLKTLRIFNYSDFDVQYSIHINKSKTQLQTMGMKIEGLQGIHLIRKGSVNNHKMVFQPRKISFDLKKKLQIKMGWLLTIKVACGPVMLVHIKSLVTKPYVTVPSVIDFGNVRCNEKVFVRLKITNENVTSCEWSVEMKKNFYETTKRKILRVGVPNPFAIEGPDMNGILRPMLEYELLISFEPRSSGDYLGELQTDVDNKRLSYITELKGLGECPMIEFSPPKIEFEGIVPHKGHSGQILTICNKGLNPVDLYLPECRSHVMEQFMLRSVLNYMQKEVYYVPACSANDTPMSNLHEMFAIIVQKAEEYFMERGMNPKDEYDSVNDYLQALEEEQSIPRADLASMVCARAEKRRKDLERGNGRLIIFTGAPTIDYIQEANLMATAMHLKVASLDQLFFEEISSKNTELASEIRTMIDNEFRKIMDDDFDISPSLAGNDDFKPILWRMKVEAINKWTDWTNSNKPEPKKPGSTLSSQTAKSKSKLKPSSTDKEETGQSENPFLRIHPHAIHTLIQERFQELIHTNGLVIDRLKSSVLRDPIAVFRLLTTMTTEQDRVDFVDMFTTYENTMERFRLQEEIENRNKESLKPRFSQICLYEDKVFDALDETMLGRFFEELKRRYILCHGSEMVELPQPEKSGKRKSKMKRKSKTGPKKRSMSYGGSPKHPSIQSFRSHRSAPGSAQGSSSKNLQTIRFVSDFIEYEAQRVEVHNFLQGRKRASSRSRLNSITVNFDRHVNQWVINSQPYQVQSRLHELLQSLLLFEEFKMSEKIQAENPSNTLERYFRLDRPRFINEIDGNIDGLWFPSLTHTFGVYSAEPDNPDCIYPIDPASIFCGISRLGFRRSNWWPDEQTVSSFHLEPNHKVSALVIFQPKETGIFEKELRVNIAEWPGHATGIAIEGVSDIPHLDLDLQTMFPPHCYALEELPLQPSLSTVQQTTLEMGPTLIPKAKGDKRYQIKSYLILKNISRVPCNMLFSLKSPSTTFELEIDRASVKANESVVLNIFAFPWLTGFRSCMIVISIEDNPIPLFIEARVEGYNLSALVSPKLVKMEHVLLSQTEKAYFKIMNDTWVPIRWKLNEREVRNHPYLNFKEKYGVLGPQETMVSIVSYLPRTVQEMEIDIDVMIRHNLDDKSKFEKGATLKLNVSSRDVVVDIVTSTVGNANRRLIFEDTYVDTIQTKSFVISNLSGFPLKFRMSFNIRQSPNLHNIFTINPTEGTLLKYRDQIIEVTAISTKPVAFKSLPLLLIEVFDVITNILVTEIAVNVTYKVFYPNYEIRPLEDLSFGSLTVGDTKVIDLVIENKGTLPLDYNILTELLPVVPPSVEPTPKRNEKHAGKHAGRKGKKKHIPSVIHEPEKLPRINLTGIHAHKPNPDHHKKGRKGRGKHKQKQKREPKSAPAEAPQKTESVVKRATTVLSEGVVSKVKPRMTHMKRSSMLRRSLMRNRNFHKKSRSAAKLMGGKISSEPYQLIWDSLRGRELLEPNTSKVVAVPFAMENTANKVNPKETANFKLIFNPQQEGDFKQTFFVDVPYSQHGIHDINVFGSGVLPSISHTLVEVLRDALINLNPENERKILEKGFPCYTYHEEIHYLELCNYIVGESTPIKLYLLNNGPVTALVQIFFTGDTTDSFSFPGNSKKQLAVSIPQKTTKPIEISFTPKSTETIEVMGHLELVMPKGIENRHYIIQMRGKGNIPLITIKRPEDFDRNENKYFMDMGIAVLNSSSVDYFSFKNIGAVVARVLVEFPITTGVFSFKARRNYRELLKHPSNDPLIEPFAITMLPGMEIEITVEYTAASKFLDTCNVYIHVIGNPYEKLVLEIYGRGINKDLNMDLPTGCVNDIESKTHRRKAISVAKVDSPVEHSRSSKERFYYVLDFGSVGLKEFSKITFTMNNSSYFNVRVSFTQNKLVWFVPHTFHIGPNCSREIIALFRSDEDVFHEDTLEVYFEPIAYTDLRADDWDINPKLFQNLLSKQGNEIELEDLLEPEIDEPSFESQSGKFMEHRNLHVAVHGHAGNPELMLLSNSIEFPPTRSYQESTAVVFVRNSGNRSGGCSFELRDLIKGNWDDVTDQKCSISLDTGNIHHPMETEPTYLINIQHPEGYTPLKPERHGYLYAPTPMKLNDTCVPNVETEEFPSIRSVSSPTNPEYNPFRVEPETLLVPPGEVKLAKVFFNPRENCSTHCTLVANFKDPGENRNGYCFLQGATLFSPCHIVCQPGRPDFDHFGWEDVKVIDVRATSPLSDAKKQFDLLNVSKKAFDFYFKKLEDKNNQTLHCNPIKGTIEPSKKKKIVLHFLPTTLQEVKSKWSLNIPSFNIEQTILFVGRVTSPDVKISPAAVTFPASLTGIFCTNSFEVLNHDETDFEFTLRQLPLPVGKLECYITPNNGIVPAGGSFPFNVRFTSQSGGNLTIQIACKLKNHKFEIIAMIFVEFFELQCMLSLQYEQDQKTKLDPSRTNDVNIGFVEPNHPQSATFILANFGKGPLRYRWQVDETQAEKRGVGVNFDRKSGVLERQSTQVLQVIFTVLKNFEFKNYIVELQVYRGPTYRLSFSGHSDLPYKFSFRTFNFGSCPVLQTGVCNYIKTLNFTNEGDHPIVLENTFSNKPHLLVLWSCGTVHPKETVSIMIEFYPVSHAFYQEDVIFNINGIVSETITFLGKGLTIAVRLSDPHKDTVDLKNVQVGSTRAEMKKIVNHSPLAVGCELEVEKHEGLKLSPSTFVIKKNDMQDLSISYSPQSKTQPFTSEVFINAGGTRNFLLVVNCSSSHVSVRLENKVLLFGRAVKYCPVQFSVNIINDGDIGVDYYWNLDKLKPLLTVTPERGHITPNSTLLSTFSLLSLKKITINQKVNLVYNGNQIADLKIVGEFTEIPEPSETINFQTLVRSSVEHTVELESRAVEPTILFPVLIGEYFSGSDFIEVLPLQKNQYIVTYSPLTMTTSAVHSGRLFVPYPDGTCVYYALIGESQPPEPEEILHWTVLSKTSNVQTFEINNWLNEFQRLRTNVNLDNADNIQHGIVSIMGEPTVCLPPSGFALYPVDVVVCKAMKFSFKIFFINPDTKEYRYYVVHVKSISPPNLPFLKMHAYIQDTSSTLLKLSNPFVEPVTFKFHSPVPDLTAVDVTAQPCSEADMVVEYSPGVIEPPKVITCHVTGQPLDQEFFKFYLVAQPSLAAPPIKVSAVMGNSMDFSIDVNNPGKHKVAYTVHIQGDDLSVWNGMEFEIPAQKNYSIELNYEPSEIGDKEHCVELLSSIGESSKRYICATSYPPKPMGPINIMVGSNEELQFKNVLNDRATFSLSSSGYIFAMALQRGEASAMSLPGVFTLESKEMGLIIIELRETEVMEHRLINSFPIAEKMEIRLVRRGNYMLDEKDVVRWVYYLKGFLTRESSKSKSCVDTPDDMSLPSA